MQEFYYYDKNSLQAVLEGLAMKTNGAVCQSYSYCKHCAEPQNILRKSTTPCADAFLQSGANYVCCIDSWRTGGVKDCRKLVKYKALAGTVDSVDNSVDCR